MNFKPIICSCLPQNNSNNHTNSFLLMFVEQRLQLFQLELFL